MNVSVATTKMHEIGKETRSESKWNEHRKKKNLNENDPVAHTDRMEMKCVARVEHTKDSKILIHTYARPSTLTPATYKTKHTHTHIHTLETSATAESKRTKQPKQKRKSRRQNTQEVIKNAKKCTFCVYWVQVATPLIYVVCLFCCFVGWLRVSANTRIRA